jgi:hypothetical protein
MNNMWSEEDSVYVITEDVIDNILAVMCQKCCEKYAQWYVECVWLCV